MRVVVFGGRGFGNPKAKGKPIEVARREYKFVFELLDALHAESPIRCVIAGKATGADTVGEDWANKRGVPFDGYPAKWDDVQRPGAVVRKDSRGRPYDAAAGSVRNQKMIDEGKPDMGVGFPGGTGTKDMADRLKKAGIRTWLVRPKASLDTP